MAEYIRDMFGLFVQEQWLKEINRQLNSVNRSINKARKAGRRVERKRYALQKLIDEYNARYNDGLGVREKEEH